MERIGRIIQAVLRTAWIIVFIFLAEYSFIKWLDYSAQDNLRIAEKQKMQLEQKEKE